MAPAPPPGPVAGVGPRIGGRILDVLAITVLVVIVLSLFGDGDRPWAGLLLAALTVWTYETVTVAVLGATPGLLAVGLRVVPLDVLGKPPWQSAARRAAVVAGLALAVPIGSLVWLVFIVSSSSGWVLAGAAAMAWVGWLVSSVGDPIGRGIADRTAATMVVPRHTRLPIATTDLPGYTDGARRPRLVHLGRVGDVDVRVRARLRRFDRRPVLALLVGVLVLAAPVIDTTLVRAALATLVWLVVFTVDETRVVARSGATPGHAIAGLVVLDRRSGLPPGVGRSFVRAVALGLQLYVLFPLLLVSLGQMRWSGTGRGLHDRIAGTVVVADPRLGPEAQRQRAMAVRLGRAG